MAKQAEKEIQVVRFRQMKPFWGNRNNEVPGNGRWAVTPVAGPEGFLHMNRDDPDVVVTEKCTVGFMHFPPGVSSPGLHVHETLDEVYFIARGEMAVRFGDGHEEPVNQYDVVFVPAGTPHGIRNVGLEDAHLVWFQNGVEREGFQLGQSGNLGNSRWLTSR